ncbi:hypothetical protein N7509_009497 [Penicillium cosmopolitanum]|uniref:Uncharacterized protein n=1 Tax=Penicillium cosmopolitanum TaxID=1131564 RepID=A0A9W9VPJ0_9EURO|nr:uncharacterized protein N7509_009497 [Penicillium cosmopolitanum]KAJ5386956.1 hypothetical protein N7509_009497 [Penicillium cosmopolitanum]
MKYFAAILSIASLALATTEVAPGNVVKQQGVGNITISPVEALRILIVLSFAQQLPPCLHHDLSLLTEIAVQTATIAMMASSA